MLDSTFITSTTLPTRRSMMWSLGWISATRKPATSPTSLTSWTKSTPHGNRVSKRSSDCLPVALIFFNWSYVRNHNTNGFGVRRLWSTDVEDNHKLVQVFWLNRWDVVDQNVPETFDDVSVVVWDEMSILRGESCAILASSTAFPDFPISNRVATTSTAIFPSFVPTAVLLSRRGWNQESFSLTSGLHANMETERGQQRNSSWASTVDMSSLRSCVNVWCSYGDGNKSENSNRQF